jgi:hypothetical protein
MQCLVAGGFGPLSEATHKKAMTIVKNIRMMLQYCVEAVMVVIYRLTVS